MCICVCVTYTAEITPMWKQILRFWWSIPERHQSPSLSLPSLPHSTQSCFPFLPSSPPLSSPPTHMSLLFIFFLKDFSVFFSSLASPSCLSTFTSLYCSHFHIFLLQLFLFSFSGHLEFQVFKTWQLPLEPCFGHLDQPEPRMSSQNWCLSSHHVSICFTSMTCDDPEEHISSTFAGHRGSLETQKKASHALSFLRAHFLPRELH